MGTLPTFLLWVLASTNIHPATSKEVVTLQQEVRSLRAQVEYLSDHGLLEKRVQAALRGGARYEQ
jgi:cell division protein FtsB